MTNEVYMKEEQSVEIIIPILDTDISILVQWLPYIKEHLPTEKIIVISSENVRDIVDSYDKLEFLNEENLVSVNKTRDYIRSISGDDPFAVKRTGWYVQQFIKLEYSKICQSEYYMSWDGDTFPLRKVQLFEDDRAVFGIKKEHHKPYFDVAFRLFGTLPYDIDGSYISEHMLFNTAVVKEMLQYIEQKHPQYANYRECILSNIDKRELPHSGFSEFETYGIYCKLFRKEMYICKEWKSLRPANNFFDFDNIDYESLKWISKDYDAVTIEKKWNVTGFKMIVIHIIHFVFSRRITHELVSCEKAVDFIQRKTSAFNKLFR